MASGKPLLTVRYSRKAHNQIDEIYEYNLEHRGLRAANRYISSLKTEIARLASDYEEGKPIEGRPHLRHMSLKRGSRWDDGHVAVYEIVYATNTVEIWFIFHTKQDWKSKL